MSVKPKMGLREYRRRQKTGELKKETMQINFRIPTSWPDEFEKLAVKLTAERGTVVSRTQAMREAMVTGLRAMWERS